LRPPHLARLEVPNLRGRAPLARHDLELPSKVLGPLPGVDVVLELGRKTAGQDDVAHRPVGLDVDVGESFKRAASESDGVEV